MSKRVDDIRDDVAQIRQDVGELKTDVAAIKAATEQGSRLTTRTIESISVVALIVAALAASGVHL